MACGSPSGSITVQVDFVKGAAIDVGPNEWLRSSPTLSPKLPVSPANVITTTGRLPFQTLIIWPRLCANPAPRWTDMTAVSIFAWAYPPAIAATVPSCRDMIPWMSGCDASASKNSASRDPGLLKTYLTPDAASCSTMICDALLEIALTLASPSWLRSLLARHLVAARCLDYGLVGAGLKPALPSQNAIPFTGSEVPHRAIPR